MNLKYLNIFIFVFILKSEIILSKSNFYLTTDVTSFHNNKRINTNTCENCEEKMAYIQRLIKNNSTDEAFDTMLIKECISILNDETECNKITKFSQKMFELISNTNTTYACKLMFQCGSICEECKIELSKLNNNINNASMSEFILLFKDFCYKFGNESEIEKCLDNVNTRQDVVIDKIREFLQNDPCLELGGCKNSKEVHQRIEFLGHKNGNYLTKISSLPKNTPAGALCSVITSMVGSIFSANLVQRGVIQLFTMFCGFLPDEQAASDCQSFMLLYLGGVMQIIQAIIPGQALCIGLLGENPEQIQWIINFNNKYVDNGEDNFNCLLCKTASDYLNKNEDLDYLKTIVRRRVEYMYMNLDMTPEEYPTIIINWTVNKFIKDVKSNLANTCNNLCEPYSIKTTSQLKEITTESEKTIDIVKDGDCFFCRVFLEVMFMVVTDNDTRETIIDKVEIVCKYMGPVKDACYNLANEYIPFLLIELRHSQTPLDLCTKLSMCENDFDTDRTSLQQSVLENILHNNLDYVKDLLQYPNNGK